MKIKLAFASAAFAAIATAAHAGTPVQQMIYNVDAAAQCSTIAGDTGHLQQGVEFCDTALRDPLMSHRDALLVDRGVIKAKLNDVNGALADYNAAIAINPEMAMPMSAGPAPISPSSATAKPWPISPGHAAGASNMAVAFFSRGIIEDDQGNYQAAYRDYKQAVALKPDFTAASRELARFKVTRRTAWN